MTGALRRDGAALTRRHRLADAARVSRLRDAAAPLRPSATAAARSSARSAAGGFRRFKPHWNRPGALCWRCGSQERHRAVGCSPHAAPSGSAARPLLHFRPSGACAPPAGERGLRYETSDLDQRRRDRGSTSPRSTCPTGGRRDHLQPRARARGRGPPRWRAAPRSSRRAAKRWSWFRSITRAPPPTKTLRSRTRRNAKERFWQHDHVRLYAPDIADRLRAAGFEVTASKAHGDRRLRAGRALRPARV